MFAFQNLDSIDIVSKGCSKGEAIKRVREHFHIKTFAGIGDSYNDLPMLEVAGLSVAAGNAVEDVKKVCDVVTKADNNEGVIAEIVERFIL